MCIPTNSWLARHTPLHLITILENHYLAQKEFATFKFDHDKLSEFKIKICIIKVFFMSQGQTNKHRICVHIVFEQNFVFPFFF